MARAPAPRRPALSSRLGCDDRAGHRIERLRDFTRQLALAQRPGEDPAVKRLEVAVPRHRDFGIVAYGEDFPGPFDVRRVAIGIACLVRETEVGAVEVLDSRDALPARYVGRVHLDCPLD